MVWAAGAGRVAAATAESRMVTPVAPAGLPRPGGRSGAGGTCRGPAASSARAAAPRGLGRFGDRRPEEAAWAQGGRAPPLPPPLAGSGRVRGQSVPRGREHGRALSGALGGRAGRHGRAAGRLLGGGGVVVLRRRWGSRCRRGSGPRELVWLSEAPRHLPNAASRVTEEWRCPFLPKAGHFVRDAGAGLAAVCHLLFRLLIVQNLIGEILPVSAALGVRVVPAVGSRSWK